MRILHVVAGLSPAGGGLSELVPRFAAEAARQGHAVTIATVAGPHTVLSDAAGAATAAGVRIVRHAPTPPAAIFFSMALARGMAALVAEADVVHTHSQWTFPVWCAARAALVAGVPLVMSPQGAFDPVRMAHSAWKKAAVAGIDRSLVQRASALHAASAAEERWIRAFAAGHRGTGRVPDVRRIPMGVDLPDAVPRAARPADRPRTVLALGRLHPLKGLDLLVAAWGEVARTAAAAGWNLVIAGPDEQGTRALLEEAIREQRIPRVTLAGPVHGAAKQRMLAEADLFVVPSRSENFGLVVPEALAAGLPVIATRGTPWSEIDGVCGWWVDVGVSPLATALAEAIGCPDATRLALGDRGRDLVERTYRWDVVGREMTGLYDAVIGRGRR